MELTPSQKKTVRHQFDNFCKKVLREEARNYAKHIAWRSEHEVSLSELSERLSSSDEQPVTHTRVVFLFRSVSYPSKFSETKLSKIYETKANI